VCEGQLDMIACYMAGVQNAVAPQGTAFTGDQARLLKRYAKEVVLCFDSDNAGQKAAVRALDDLLQTGLSVRVATLPSPHDPDSFTKEFGAEAFQKLIDSAAGFFDFYLNLLVKQHDINSDRGRREVARAMSSALAKTGDQFLFDKYARETAARFGADTVSAVAAFRKLAADAAPRPNFREPITYDDEPEEEESAPPLAPPSPAELWLVKIALLQDDLLEWLAAHLDFSWIQDDRVKEILELRLHQNDDGSWPGASSLFHHLDANPPAQDLITEVTTEQRSIREAQKVLADSLLRLRNQAIDRQINALANRRGSTDITPDEFADLTRQHFALHQARSQPLSPLSDTAY
jgi:DNA primase